MAGTAMGMLLMIYGVGRSEMADQMVELIFTKTTPANYQIGHLICWRCGWIITYTPNGRFSFKHFNDNDQMSKIFENMPLKNPLISILLGVGR